LVPLPTHFRTPQQILHELGIQAPSEIRLEAIAQHCRAAILYEPLEGSDARLVGYRDRAIITVNKASTPYRQRFSTAHELGHWMWDRGKMAFHCQDQEYDGSVVLDSCERRANRYAVELLLPETMFVPMLESHGLSLATADRLSEVFQTSLMATAIRMLELTPHFAVLIYSEAGKRRWYVRSASVSRDLKLVREVPENPMQWCLELPGALEARREGLHAETRPMEEGSSLSLLVWE